MTRHIASLATVGAQYKVLFCDVWGVIHNGREAFRGACDALSRWRAERGPVILISNSPRPATDVVRQLDALGVPRESWSDLVTSGDVTRALIAERGRCTAFRIGPDRDSSLYSDLPLTFTSIEQASFIVCTGPNDDEVETPEDYRAILTRGVEIGLDMICANPDLVVQRGDKLIYCGGALADLYAKIGGRVLMAGKPYPPIYELCFVRARGLVGDDLAASNVLAVGDGVATDLRGARSQGLDALYVASGIHAASAEAGDGRLDVTRVDAFLAAQGATTNFVMSNLSW